MWEAGPGETQFIFRRGMEYHLVTESSRFCDGGEWLTADAFGARHRGSWLEDFTKAEKRFDFSAQPLSRAEAVQWFHDTLVTDFVPEELRAEFRPRPAAAPIEPREALQRLRLTMNGLVALATLAVGEVSKYREDDPGVPGVPDEIGAGLEMLTKAQCAEVFTAWGEVFEAISDHGDQRD